jgi:catabolite regulation protein CreA
MNITAAPTQKCTSKIDNFSRPGVQSLVCYIALQKEDSLPGAQFWRNDELSLFLEST